MTTWGHDSCMGIDVVVATAPLPPFTFARVEALRSILASRAQKRKNYHSDSPVAFEKR
jgi:hypothetical protein